MTDRFLVSVLLTISRIGRWTPPFETCVHKELNGPEELFQVHSAICYLIDRGHVVDSGSELVLTIGGKKWLGDHRHLLEQVAGHIEATVDERGYTLFRVDGKNVLGYQKVEKGHYLIPAEEPAQSYTSPGQASKAICSTLKRLGGDVSEFLRRPNNPFQLPS
jgi:hypothetical protein